MTGDGDTGSGSWVKLVHACEKPKSAPSNADAGSIWQCRECGVRWLWVFVKNSPNFMFRSPWEKLDNKETDNV